MDYHRNITDSSPLLKNLTVHHSSAKLPVNNLTSQQAIVWAAQFVKFAKLGPSFTFLLLLPIVINLDCMSIIQIYWLPASQAWICMWFFNLRLSGGTTFIISSLFKTALTRILLPPKSSLFKVISFATPLEMKWDVWFGLIRFHALLPPTYGLSANWSSFQLKSPIFVLILC